MKKFTHLQLLITPKLPYGDHLTWFNLFCVSAESMRLGLTQRSTEQRLNFWFSSYSSFYSKICRIHRLQVKNLYWLQNMQKVIPYKHSDRVKAQSECKDIVDTLFLRPFHVWTLKWVVLLRDPYRVKFHSIQEVQSATTYAKTTIWNSVSPRRTEKVLGGISHIKDLQKVFLIISTVTFCPLLHLK